VGITSRQAYVALASAAVATIAVFVAALLYGERSQGRIVISSAADDGQVVVWVTGAVATPGIYTLTGSTRVNDALIAAGGAAPDADVSSLNLAERLRDEQHLEIPSRHAASTPDAIGIRVPDAGLIDINTAGEELLDELPGVGPAIAGRIVAYREANGPFTRVEELARVDGISPDMVDELRPLITAGQ
jgi:competence protein ComEA